MKKKGAKRAKEGEKDRDEGGREKRRKKGERERERVEMRRSCRGFGVYSLLSRWSPTPNGSPRLYPGPS